MSPATRSTITILQVSDQESAGIFKPNIGENWSSQKKWSEAKRLLIESLHRSHPGEIQALVLNGDCVKGSKGEKETAESRKKKFDDFSSHFVIPLTKYLREKHGTKHVILVPGNHDVLRNKTDGGTGVDGISERLKLFFEMVDGLSVSLAGESVQVSAAPKSSMEPIKPVVIEADGFLYELHPLNSALLSGAPMETITRLLSGEEYSSLIEKPKKAETADAATASDSKLLGRLSSDAALIPQRHLDHLAEKSPDPRFRIAVVHHNSLPYPGESSGRVKSYGFCNGGALHDRLLSGGFQLVMHGHQHESRVFELKDHTRADNNAVTGGSGLLVVGAPSFGSDESPAHKTGYNLIVISRPSRETAISDIRHVEFSTNRGGVNQTSMEVHKSVHFSSLARSKEEIRRHQVAREISEQALLTDNPEMFERFLESVNALTGEFYGGLRQSRNLFQFIHAIYSVSVFEPGLWGEQRLAEFFLPEARRNLARAASVAKSLEAEIASQQPGVEDFKKLIHGAVPGLHFCFSQPVFDGVQKANKNAETFRVASRFCKEGNLDEALVEGLLENRPRDLRSREMNFFSRTLRSPMHAKQQNPVNRHDSVSVWDNATSVDGLALDDEDAPNIPAGKAKAAAERLLSRPFYEGIHLSLSCIKDFEPTKPGSKTDVRNYLQLFEFPRIVLWTKEHFMQPQALECIEFHEYCGFPLFWLDPKRLRGAQGRPRQVYGHYTMLGKTADREMEDRSVPNDTKGKRPDFGDFSGNDHMRGMTEAFWGPHNVPVTLQPNANHIEEFMWLVLRPEIMFAADVWAISRLSDGAWEELENFLDTTTPTPNASATP